MAWIGLILKQAAVTGLASIVDFFGKKAIAALSEPDTPEDKKEKDQNEEETKK